MTQSTPSNNVLTVLCSRDKPFDVRKNLLTADTLGVIFAIDFLLPLIASTNVVDPTALTLVAVHDVALAYASGGYVAMMMLSKMAVICFVILQVIAIDDTNLKV